MVDKIYLLTGATGLLGGNILKQLIELGENVRALVSPNNPALAYMPKGVEIVEGNLLDEVSLENFFSVPEDKDITVIHAAGIVTMDPRPNPQVYSVNVDGTNNIIQKCLEHKVHKLIYISSTGAIPEPPNGEEIRETESLDPHEVVGYYAKTKAMATELVLKAVKDNGLNASIIYPSGIFGPNDYRFGMITSAVKMIAEKNLRISIEGTFNGADARDLAKGIIACSRNCGKGESYIMAGDCYTFTQLADAICQAAGHKKTLFTIPLWLIRPFAPLGIPFSKITGQPPWFSSYTTYNLSRNNNFSSEKAEKELGFQCRPLQETIEDTIQWLQGVKASEVADNA